MERPPQKDNDPIAGCEHIVAGMPSPPAIRHGGNRACYWPGIDQISMPKRETFVSSEAYYSTLYHELCHSTGHPDRLNRKTLVAGAPFRSPVYSREELTAEMGAAFLCAQAGIGDPTIDNSCRLPDRGGSQYPEFRSEGVVGSGGAGPERLPITSRDGRALRRSRPPRSWRKPTA